MKSCLLSVTIFWYIWCDRKKSGKIELMLLQEVEPRHKKLSAARKRLREIPCRELFELSGRPTVAYEIRDYSGDSEDGKRLARFELPFLFKAFEYGQTGPPRAGSKNANEPRAATIHEYLDWTVTAEEPSRPVDMVNSSFLYCFLSVWKAA